MIKLVWAKLPQPGHILNLVESKSCNFGPINILILHIATNFARRTHDLLLSHMQNEQSIKIVN